MGRPLSTALGRLTATTPSNEYGEATPSTATAVTGAGPAVVYDEQMQRDALGRQRPQVPEDDPGGLARRSHVSPR